MSNLSDLEKQLDTLKGIDNNEVRQPGMPVSAFIKECESLYAWCQADKQGLITHGLEWQRVELLPSCLGALRLLQSKWNVEHNKEQEALKTWNAKLPAAFDLRNTLLHDFRYAYRNDPEIMGLIVSIAHGSSHTDVIQNLNDLAVLGKENPAPLVAINFDTGMLVVAVSTADMLNELLSLINGDHGEQSETRLLRDKAYSLCKSIMDEIRVCGQYVFWHNPDRVKGYISTYVHRIPKKRKFDTIKEK